MPQVALVTVRCVCRKSDSEIYKINDSSTIDKK
jgi:hypothetical protein